MVNVAANTPPTLGAYANTFVAPGATVTIAPTVPPSDNGSISSLTVTGSAGFLGTATANSTTGVVTLSNVNAGNYTLTVTATDNCGATASKTFAVDFGPPTGVTATATSATAVSIAWQPIAGATAYQVWRRAAGGAFVSIGSTPGTAFVDTTVVANAAYLYQVRAISASAVSPFSAIDPAITIMFADDPLSAGVVVKAVHIQQLRTAVNALRSAAGLLPLTFSDDPLVAGTSTIRRVHVSEIRGLLDSVRTAIALPPIAYTDPTITSATPVKAVHLQELRNAMK